MNPVRKLTFSAMVAAVCFVCLLAASTIPGMCLSLTALAGLFPAAVVIVCGLWWALGVWAAVSALSFLLLPTKAAAALFLCFFGHYPVWKSLIEMWGQKRRSRVCPWLLKFLTASICLALMYVSFRTLLFQAETPVLFYSEKGWVMGLFFLLLLVAFAAYDFAFSRLIGFFQFKILPRIQKRS